MLCATALVLLMDVSGSVSAENFRLQREGVAAALRDPGVVRTVESGPPMALTLIEWDSRQAVVLPWRVLRDRDDLARAADLIEAAPRALAFGATHAGDAMAAALDAIEAAPCVAEQAVIDVSGDGEANGGQPAAALRDRAAAMGVQVNGLAIVTDTEPMLGQWYRDNVMTADGFVIEAEGFADVARAMRRKIIVEISRAPAAPHPAKKEG